MERVEFTVKGMTCDNCVASVTQALKQVDGVKVAKVSLTEERAQVTYDGQKASMEDLKTAIQSAGYEVA
ncbi:MAG: copper ion binding protein [Firmicutes bacterium]|jgi:copper ion binding protein|nr:copper ion binding protein [Bacillota bacterium]MCL5065074.1 copper ion binding protein [Bacillota bacterium]